MADATKPRSRGKGPSGLVAFLLTDIEGSTRFWQSHPELMRQVIQRHDQLVTECIRARGGRILNDHGEGDSFFAVFPRVSETLAAARDIQRAIHGETWPSETPIRVRIAINTGEAVGDYRGMAANRAGRIRQLAHGGQVLISQATGALVRDELPAGISLVDLGVHRLRDVAAPEHVFEARVDGLPDHAAPDAPLRHRFANLRRTPRRTAFIAVPVVALVVVVFLIAGSVMHPGARTSSLGAPTPSAQSLLTLKIATVAGNGTPGYTSGITRATDAELNHPAGIAVDSQGNVFIADTLNNRVRVLRPDGSLIDYVGGGQQFTADGRIGTEITLKRPTDLQVDNQGNLCIADTGNNRVLVVDPGDHVTLVAGSGAKGAPNGSETTSGVKFDSPTGVDCVFNAKSSLFSDCRSGIGRGENAGIIDSGTHLAWFVSSGIIEKFRMANPTNYQDMPPLAPGGAPDLVQTIPTGQLDCIDGGDLFISDTGANLILKRTAAGKLSTFAGTGVAGYSGDNGPASAAQLNMPEGLALDWTYRFRVFFADTGNNVVRVVDRSTILTIAGNGSAGSTGDSGPAIQAELSSPTAVAVAQNGDIYIADTGNNRIRVLRP